MKHQIHLANLQAQKAHYESRTTAVNYPDSTPQLLPDLTSIASFGNALSKSRYSLYNPTMSPLQSLTLMDMKSQESYSSIRSMDSEMGATISEITIMNQMSSKIADDDSELPDVILEDDVGKK